VKTYHVFHAPEGSDETYLGVARTLKDAKRMATQHENGELIGLGRYLYTTADAAGQQGINGLCRPPECSEAVKWFGLRGEYAACVEMMEAKAGAQ